MPGRLRPWLALAVLALVDFVMVFDGLAVAVALPSIQHDLGFSAAALQWVVSAYALTFGGFLLLGGRLGDLQGRRRILVAGFAVFAVGSLVGGVAWSSTMLVAGRALQGLGASLSAPASLALVAAIFREGPERDRAVGIWAAVSGSGVVAGALVGGLVTAGLGWRWVLLVNLPVAVVMVAGVFAVVPEERDPSAPRRFDVAGAVLATSGLAALIYAAVRLGETPTAPASAPVLAAFALAVVLLGAFVALERRVKAPLVRFDLFRLPGIAGGNVGSFAVSGGYAGVLFLLTLYLQNVLGFDPLTTGLAFLPFAVCTVVGAPFAARLTSWAGPRRVAPAGLGVIAFGMLLLAQAPADGSYLRDVLPGSVLAGLGAPLAYVPATVASVAGVDARRRGLASGVYNTSAQLGGALVVATLGVVTAARGGEGRAGLTMGLEAAHVVGALVLVAAAVAVVLLLTSESSERPEAEVARGGT